MRILCLFLLVCLLLAGPVAAIAVSPAELPTVVRITSKPPTIVPLQPQKAVYQVSLPPTPVLADFGVTSLPPGATLTFDGTRTTTTTPFVMPVTAGTHTFVLSLEGYEDYTRTVDIPEWGAIYLTVSLEPVRKSVAARQNMSAIPTVQTQPALISTIVPGILPDQEHTGSCLSGQECLALHEAAAQYPQGGYYYQTGGPACGRVTLSNGTVVPRYCISVPAGSGVHTGRVPAMVTVPVAQKVNAVNATALSGIQANATPRVLGAKRETGVIDSVLGFFNGLFSNPVCPQGQTVCDGRCADLMTDSSHCGRCDYFCFEPGVCSGGECVESDAAGMRAPPIPL